MFGQKNIGQKLLIQKFFDPSKFWNQNIFVLWAQKTVAQKNLGRKNVIQQNFG